MGCCQVLEQDDAAKLLKEMATGAAGRTLRVLPKQLAVELLCHMGNPAAWAILKALTDKAVEELLSRVTLDEGLSLTHVCLVLYLPNCLYKKRGGFCCLESRCVPFRASQHEYDEVADMSIDVFPLHRRVPRCVPFTPPFTPPFSLYSLTT